MYEYVCCIELKDKSKDLENRYICEQKQVVKTTFNLFQLKIVKSFLLKLISFYIYCTSENK